MPLNYNESIVLDKGLSNYLGHNNCFLNSAVQVFWHLQVFRKNFLAMKNHNCVEGSCIYCALQDIFKEFKESDENTLNPDMLRLTLACSFQDQAKFQLGELDDAAECYEKILSRIHFHLSGGAPDDFCSLKHCITHAKFAMSLIQQSSCECNATSEPLSYVQLVHYVSTSSIVECSKILNTNDFSEVLRCAFNQGSSHSTCPLKCGLKSKLTRTLINHPDVISIGLIWNSDQPDPDHIREFVSTIGQELTLNNLFDSAIDVDQSNGSIRELVGVVCYYFKHYSTFFKRSKDGMWISFDDASVSEIGETWDKVIDKCCRGKYQPLLLIYQNKEAQLVDTKSAPKKTSIIKKSFEETRSGSKGNRLRPSCSQTSNQSSSDITINKMNMKGKNKKVKKQSSSDDIINKITNAYYNSNQQHQQAQYSSVSTDVMRPHDFNPNQRTMDQLNSYKSGASYDGLAYPFTQPSLLTNYTNGSMYSHNDLSASRLDRLNYQTSLLSPSASFPGGTNHFKDPKALLNEVHAKITNDNRNRLLKIQQNQLEQQPAHQYTKDKYQEPCSTYPWSNNDSNSVMKPDSFMLPTSLSPNNYSANISNGSYYNNHSLPQHLLQHGQLYNTQQQQHPQYQRSQLQHQDNYLNSYHVGQTKFLEPANNAAFLKNISDNLSSDHYNLNTNMNTYDNNFMTFPKTKNSRNIGDVGVHGKSLTKAWTPTGSNDVTVNDDDIKNLNINERNIDYDDLNKNAYVNRNEFFSHRHKHCKCNTTNELTNKSNNPHSVDNSKQNNRSNNNSTSSSYENLSPEKTFVDEKDYVVLSHSDVTDPKNLMEFDDDKRLFGEKIRALYKS